MNWFMDFDMIISLYLTSHYKFIAIQVTQASPVPRRVSAKDILFHLL